jgi:hypothetical protein
MTDLRSKRHYDVRRPATPETPVKTTLTLALLLSVGAMHPAAAVPGPDVPDEQSTYRIFAWNQQTEQSFRGATFREADGWDFGDRYGYECAWSEFFDGGALLFTVTIQRVRGNVGINDKYGAEVTGPDADPECPTETPAARFDGSDHFPHHTMFHFERAGIELAILDLHARPCARAYWTPGDEPGEAWMWWDKDGPRSDGHHRLDCGGGRDDPKPVARAIVQMVAPDITVCTEDSLHGDRCSSHHATWLSAGETSSSARASARR